MVKTRLVNSERPPFCITRFPYVVLCEQINALGHIYKFGETMPAYADILHQHEHYKNGVIGSKEELEILTGKPVELTNTDPLNPIAKFVSNPELIEEEIRQEQEVLVEKEKTGGEILSLHNATLFKKKQDLSEYAKLFGIRLKIASNISKGMMIENLKNQAVKKGIDILEFMDKDKKDEPSEQEDQPEQSEQSEKVVVDSEEQGSEDEPSQD